MKKIIPLACLLCIVFFQNSWSQKFPSQGEIYSFNPGDEFQVLHYYCCNEKAFQLEQIRIIKKVLVEDTIEYQCVINVFDFLNSSPPQLIDTSIFNKSDTIRIVQPDSIFFVEGDIIQADPNIYNGRKTGTHYFWIFDALCIEQYALGLGLVHRAWKMAGMDPKTADSLIYYSKGNEYWGETLLQENQSFARDKITLVPNPVKSILSIKNIDPGIKIKSIILSDIEGKTIRKINQDIAKNSLLITIDCQKLTAGVYFIYLSTNKGSRTYKFIKD